MSCGLKTRNISWRSTKGFTLIELLVTLAIIATLLSLAAPRYFGNLDKAKEDVLREDLYLLRDAIDKFYADKGKYPDTLQDLVEHKYLRRIPIDPLTQSKESWLPIAPAESGSGAIADVRSAAPGQARDKTWFKDW
ncbi:prepilin-type N-terminal cleavage/methylation domain-containing protein [Chitinimonas arctica]|uniref:Prepilin-type N-terminal cleavage/methylation domain-containing protein n=2 Tax=Chitinimonas arctica TaxID=2594795 RepID=A0A516SM30_9NEIS|nr:prepilin-type N-terminal cleavage/methylation domain-containing protein [Chitinimonas arctica]